MAATTNNDIDVIVPKLYLKAVAWVFALIQSLIVVGVIAAVSAILDVRDQQTNGMSQQRQMSEEIARLSKNLEELMPREVADLQHRDFERRISEMTRQMEMLNVAVGLKLKADSEDK